MPVERAARIGRIAEVDLADREASLLATARELFYEGGFEGTSIEAVARAARVSPKTIYARFGGKAGLFSAVMMQRASFVHAALDAPLTDLGDVRTALENFAIRLAAVVSSPEATTMQRVVISQAEAFPELASAIYEAGPQRGKAMLAAFFERAVKAKALAIDDPAFAAEMFSGALLGVPLRHFLLARQRPTRAAEARRAKRVVDFFLRMYAPPR